MNENQMNTQNVGNNESVNQNMGVPVQPIPQNVGVPPVQAVDTNMGVPVQPMPQNVGVPPVQATNNFMEDFSQAVVPQPEVVPPVAPASMPEQPSQTVPTTNVEPTPEIQTVPVQSEPVVENTVKPQPTAVTELAETVAAETQTSTEDTTKIGKKKKNNWAFIIALFAIVGIFVLMLPLLVRMFGY